MKRIREKRIEKGWTQLELAKKSGVPPPSISQIENIRPIQILRE